MNAVEQFNIEKQANIREMGNDKVIKKLGVDFVHDTGKYRYSYNFTWMGRPIIAFPQDMIAMQELIWQVKPDLIIETGVAHGGSIVYYASLLELIGGPGLVVGIDIDIRSHNREAIEAHPMMKRIRLLEGSSVSPEILRQVAQLAKAASRVLVCLDSNHTHEHVLQELQAYSSFVTVGSYCVVFDTVVEDMPADYDWGTRPWGKGNNPKTAVWEFLKENLDFEVDPVEKKLLITVAPEGFLKRVR